MVRRYKDIIRGQKIHKWATMFYSHVKSFLSGLFLLPWQKFQHSCQNIQWTDKCMCVIFTTYSFWRIISSRQVVKSKPGFQRNPIYFWMDCGAFIWWKSGSCFSTCWITRRPTARKKVGWKFFRSVESTKTTYKTLKIYLKVNPLLNGSVVRFFKGHIYKREPHEYVSSRTLPNLRSSSHTKT